ncbi:asparagine--tRNA ligase [Anaeromassilibacillus sp. An172]|uniref:asparagine--tRNA ligase n=1 Tax=Anaeromassilibacillus sp. An172 TaxID=1965570 RepID=UPI000B37F25D|nr:asparagine--tRNA ligase [Anaeromassilibacillus sp. An172]MEE0763117.1 asparagine--tRNA ligase [Acutalibacteraceae bacterium]OUP79768.1 asparagine--tRNA ligase [Anaeromassilibacillus sp. An172]
MKHIDIKDIQTKAEYVDTDVTVCGWVRTSRDSKNMAFLEMNDGTSLKHLQIVIDKSALDNYDFALKLGTALKVTGTVVPARQGSVEINAKEITLLGDCPADYPLQKKRHTLEFLRTMPHLRVRTNTFNAVLRVRSVMAASIHKYFQDRNYVYINTPLLTGSDCEGAGEVFKVTTIGYSDQYKSEEEYYSNDFFGKKAGLSVSGQLEGEVAAMAMGKIYTFGPSFRAENSNTPRHVAEFWHIEPEVAFAELDDIIEIAEDMIKYIVRDVMEKCPQELAFFNQHFEKGLIDKLQHLLDSEFEILDYTKAIEILKDAKKEFVYPVEWGCDLQTEHERYITEEVFNKPVFITNYPKDIKSFYMKQNPDGKTVAATDLLVPGVGEIIGCSEREADYDKLVEAMKARNMNMDEYADYLELRKFGSVPHSGFGLGFERIIMYVTGMSNIRDVILYPRTVGSIR